MISGENPFSGGGIFAAILATFMLPACGPASFTHTPPSLQSLKAQPQTSPEPMPVIPTSPGPVPIIPSTVKPLPPQELPPETDANSGVSGPLPPGYSQKPPQVQTKPAPANNSESALVHNVPMPEIPLSPPPPEAVVERGQIRASIYYIYNGDEDQRGCATGEKITLNDPNGKPMIQVCPETAAGCAMQGTCQIKQNGNTSTYNIISKSQQRYFRVNHQCVYGFGVKNYCLDPFYSVAADPDFYSPGTVIFVPAIRGLELPNGKLHHGYLIVRDRGDNSSDQFVKGKGRFDFFTGNLHYLSKQNPFAKIGLGSRATRHEYQRVTGDLADQVRKMRNFPLLPVPLKH